MPGRSLAVPLTASHSPRENMLEALDRYFEAIEADTPDLIRQAHEIRYRVYCLETGFENPAANPDGLEKDAFDSHSVHGVLVHRASHAVMGTVRLVLPLAEAPERSFAVQQVSDHPALTDNVGFPLRSTAEVSRFCISRQFRRRASDTLYDQEGITPTAANDPGERRNGPLMRLGLIQVLVRMSARYGITHWCAVMEPKLLRMLDAMAIRFKPIGPLVEHHGVRQPCSCNIAEALRAVKTERPAFWDVLTRGGIIKI